MNAQRDTSYDDHLLQALADPREAAAYLDAVMELEGSAALMLALRQVAKAQGLTGMTDGP
jgi:DNA-binding phage protein